MKPSNILVTSADYFRERPNTGSTNEFTRFSDAQAPDTQEIREVQSSSKYFENLYTSDSPMSPNDNQTPICMNYGLLQSLGAYQPVIPPNFSQSAIPGAEVSDSDDQDVAGSGNGGLHKLNASDIFSPAGLRNCSGCSNHSQTNVGLRTVTFDEPKTFGALSIQLSPARPAMEPLVTARYVRPLERMKL